MNRSSGSACVRLGAAAFGAALVLTSCGAANEAAPTGDGEGAAEVTGASGSIAGAGASSQAAAVQAWIAGFTGANPDATITYDPIGSGGGREQFIAGGTAFAGSDAYLDEEELPAATERCGGDVIEVPLYISPIALIYNLEGVDALNLPASTVAGIFAGTITNWNDPAIAADNPDATLPDLAITAVHRSDESGTTENFAEYLAAAAPDVWTFEVSGDWPLPGGAAAQGTSGVVGAVGGGNGTIGYADASQAGDLGIVNVGVGTEFVGPSAEAASTVVQVSERVAERGEYSFAYNLARDTGEEGAYPIVLVSYTLACGSYDDAAQGELVRTFVTYMASDEGQQVAAENAGSAPLSDALQEQLQPAIDAIGATQG